MPTNQQRRATAKRKLERQLERRAKQAKRRRILLIAGSAIAAVAVVAGVVVAVVTNKDDDKTSTATSTTPSSSAAAPSDANLPPVNLGDAGPMPAFKPPANLGANCQYPAAQEKAAKEVKPPRTGKVPTEPAKVSVSMMTNQGPIGLILANNESPCTVNSFISLATQNFFKDTKCHRMVASPMLSVLQCGDPSGTGTGGPGYQFANEFPSNQFPANDPRLKNPPVVYPRGTLAMAHSEQPNSNGSQFFMVFRDSALPPDYTVFGTIQADGLATLDKIAAGGVTGTGQQTRPVMEVTIASVLPD